MPITIRATLLNQRMLEPFPIRRNAGRFRLVDVRVKLSNDNPRGTKRNLSPERGLYKLINQNFMYTRPVFLAFILSLSAVAAVPNQYIVEISGDPVAVHMVHHAPGKSIQSEEAKQKRAQIREDRKPVQAQLEAAQAQILDSVDTVANAFIVNIPDAKAATLASIPGVIHVYPVRRFKLNLDHALPLHRVPQAWQQVGLNNAGAGIKIGMIDTGIDIAHPGFQDPTMKAPSGFPLVNAASDLAFTNGKVIVARSYASLFQAPDPDPSARDHVGHGTATAMAAAGTQNTGPLATISGVAP